MQGDCADVERRIANSEIEDWPTTEVRHSFQLLSGFCEELAAQKVDARETYRAIIREAPLSFASDDARERLRIMRLAANDPDYESWVASARVRALGGSSLRTPLNRTPVAYPPLAFRNRFPRRRRIRPAASLRRRRASRCAQLALCPRHPRRSKRASSDSAAFPTRRSGGKRFRVRPLATHICAFVRRARHWAGN